MDAEQYSHRNGETEPPAETGWYWLKRREIDGRFPPLVFVTKKSYKRYFVIYGRDLEDVPVKDVRGQWWGPVTPPWKQPEQ